MKKQFLILFVVMLMVSISYSAPALYTPFDHAEHTADITLNNDTYNYTKCLAWGRVAYVEAENVSTGVYRNVSFNSIFLKVIPIPPDFRPPLIDRYFPFRKFEMEKFTGILRVGYIAGICTNVIT